MSFVETPKTRNGTTPTPAFLTRTLTTSACPFLSSTVTLAQRRRTLLSPATPQCDCCPIEVSDMYGSLRGGTLLILFLFIGTQFAAL